MNDDFDNSRDDKAILEKLTACPFGKNPYPGKPCPCADCAEENQVRESKAGFTLLPDEEIKQCKFCGEPFEFSVNHPSSDYCSGICATGVDRDEK